MAQFKNATEAGDIPSFNGTEEAKATDFANYFCSYSQIFHQKQMLSDTHRMAAYHAAILSNPDVFKDKVVMDVGTGSGILAVWAAQAGARKVFAVEYTDMAHNARKVMKANNVDHIVTVVQGAVENVELPGEDVTGKVDIIISEWMGYFLLRESMLDSLIRARDKYLRPDTGLMFPSHCTMFFAPIMDEEDRQQSSHEYQGSMNDWFEFVESTTSTYGVDMKCLEPNYEKEQREYYMLSSKWSELPGDCVIAEPAVVKTLDMATCTLHESKGILSGASAPFNFKIEGGQGKVCSGFAGWFTSDFKSRTDDAGRDKAPKITNPVLLNTGPENGYTHWGQQVFHLTAPISLIQGEETDIQGELEMMRSTDNVRLYQCRIKYEQERKNKANGVVLNKGKQVNLLYQMP